MHFTVVFSGDEQHDLSFGLVFTSSPCWMRGDQQVLNLNPHTPKFEVGSVGRLFDTVGIREEVARGGGNCAVIVHLSGSGEAADLAALVADLEKESLVAKVVYQSM